MTLVPIVVPPGLAAGQIEFYDRITPPIQVNASPYTLHAEQQILGLPTAVDPYVLDQPFTVAGPRFTIDPASIQSVFPPANALGNYDSVLPSIVFKDFPLPWIRSIVPGNDDPETGPPWMALLTIYPSEMAAAPNKPPNPTAVTTFPTTLTAADLVNPGTGIVGPALPGETADATKVSVIDLDGAYFTAIAPSAAELQYLAHGRAVNTDGKVMLGMKADGCFSVVVGNRIAQSGTGDTPFSNTVILVSLEGHIDHLPGGSTPIPTGSKIRLAVLGVWTFLAAPARGSFVELLQDICAADRGGVRLLRLGVPSDGNADPMAAEALAIGYVPLANDLRDGETTTSFYRGPFTAGPTARADLTGRPYYFSDAAIFYDLDYGIFNHAYAAAWQAGRLLALSDAAFVQAIADWRRAYAAKQRTAANHASVVLPTSRALLGTLPPAHDADLMNDMRSFFAERMADVAPNLPTVTPRFEHAELDALLGAIGVRANLTAPADGDADPLVALRARLRGAPQ
jgi:hypothetical protein